MYIPNVFKLERIPMLKEKDCNRGRTVAFDVDGTLINIQRDTPRYDVIDLFLQFYALGFRMVIWSGGGEEYATRWTEKLGLIDYVTKISAKNQDLHPYIAVDDEEVTFGTVNIQV